jgi:UDP-N-acetylglucosamine 2-epimerase (non-hydrolysing)
VAPVALAMAEHAELNPVIVHSGQHRMMVRQALEPFGLAPDIELVVDRPTGSQAELAATLLPALDDVLVECRPAATLVQGDTTTTVAGALASFWRAVPLVHLEAGLRTGDLARPFPEEGNRQMVSRIASLHLAPTSAAADALRAENVSPARIVVTGNTVVDAVQQIARANLPPRNDTLLELERRVDERGGRLILVTVHRRESWGEPLNQVLAAVREVVARHEDCFVALPTHPNPAVSAQVRDAVSGQPRISVLPPLDYPDLVRVLRRAALVVTDSGGIQEEAPTFGTPTLVVREVTERLEAVRAGCAWVVGTTPSAIVRRANWILDSGLRFPLDANPYGDGKAGLRAVEEIEQLISSRRH